MTETEIFSRDTKIGPKSAGSLFALIVWAEFGAVVTPRVKNTGKKILNIEIYTRHALKIHVKEVKIQNSGCIVVFQPVSTLASEP